MLANATEVDDAIRFVSGKSKEKLKLLNSINEDEKELNEPDHTKDKDQLQEEKTGEITINHVF